MKAYQKSNGQYTLAGTIFISEKDMFFALIGSNTKTKDLKETMLYLMNLYQGKTTYDESRFSMYEPEEFTAINRTGSRGGLYYGFR